MVAQVAVIVRSMSVSGDYVHNELVLCSGCHFAGRRHLQIHRIQRVCSFLLLYP